MTAITIRLPNSVHQKLKELAARDERLREPIHRQCCIRKNDLCFDSGLSQG